jgi:hypothetical protein
MCVRRGCAALFHCRRVHPYLKEQAKTLSVSCILNTNLRKGKTAILMDFRDLVRDGNTQAVRKAIDAGARIDAPDGLGFTPLMIACYERRTEVARLLVERGAKLDATALRGETALTIAMVRCAGIALLLVDRGVLGRPLRAPLSGNLLPIGECDVCTRYADEIDPDDRWSGAPADLAWLEIIREERSTDGKMEYAERELRCPYCGTGYHQRFAYEVETAGVTLPYVSECIRRCPATC